MHNECFRGIREVGLFYLHKLIFLECFLVFSCLPWVCGQAGWAGFCCSVPAQAEVGAVSCLLFLQCSYVCMNNWNCFLKWVITCEFAWWRLLVLNQWTVNGGVRKFLCSFLGAYSNDGVATERRAAGWQQLLWMGHKPFSCASGHSPGTLCQINCCPQTAVGVMGQYPWDLSVGALGSASSLCLCPCVPVF